MKGLTRLAAVVYFLTVLPLLSDVLSAQAPIIADSAAARHVGEAVTVEGYVAAVFTSRTQTTFLNFGRAYPNQTFTAVIFRSAASRFPNPRQWEGQRVRVTGQVRLYQGRPEIILEQPSQIQAVP